MDVVFVFVADDWCWGRGEGGGREVFRAWSERYTSKANEECTFVGVAILGQKW
jgi:hypothetical protein